MITQIHSAIISTFQNPYSFSEWLILRDALKSEGFKNVNVRNNTFRDNPEVDIRTSLYFYDHELLVLFLEKEHKVAMDTQDFEWAALIREKQNNLNPDVKTFDEGFLRFSIQQKSRGVCEIMFETNILYFKNKFIEESISFSRTTKEIDFYEFSEFWNCFIRDNIQPQDYEKLWKSDTEWTKKVLSEELKSSLNKKFNLNNKLWYEWRKFDLTIGTNDHFDDIYGYDLDETFEENSRITGKESLLEYPKHQLLLLEHENDFRTALNELIKLTYERAKIKVLITYPLKISHRLALITNTLKILDQSDKFLPEYVSEYILVFGELIDKVLYWSFYQFGYNGVLLNAHFFSNSGKYKSIEKLTIKDFESHIIWQDSNTVEFSTSNNSIKMIDAVKPEQNDDNNIIQLVKVISPVEYSEKYYVACNYSCKNRTYSGYVTLTTDYDFKRDGMLETFLQPVIINEITNEHIPLSINSEKQRTEICNKLKIEEKNLFPLKFEIQAKLKGVGLSGNNKGVINGFLKY